MNRKLLGGVSCLARTAAHNFWQVNQTGMKMDAIEVIRRWRALPAEEKHLRRWASIPRSVARSMALSGEPVDQAVLEAAHALRAIPGLTATSDGNGNHQNGVLPIQEKT